jgi:hypothetical protein
LIDLSQLSKINEFKRELSEKGVLYKEFNSISNFESLFRINITNLISDKLLSLADLTYLKLEDNLIKDRYLSITNLINEVEQKDNQSIELDIFELIETLSSNLNTVTSYTESMTVSLNDLSEKMNRRTSELIKLSAIKDNRLRLEKTQIIVNLLAGELTEFNSRINLDLPGFSETFIQIGPLYSQIMQYENHYSESDVAVLKKSIVEYRDVVEKSTHQSASLLKEMGNWPPATSKFNKNKRETEVVLKDITKHMLSGLKLLDEAVKE